MLLAAGTMLGPYEIVAPLGAGGMGEVYRARDSRLGREVAIKVLPQHLSANPEVRARFEREAKTVSSLNHPNLCTLFDVGRAPGEAGSDDIDYLVMELVDGETLAARIARGPLPLAEVLRVASQIAGGLDRAHRANVIHRDLKPGNIMLTKNGAKLMDFGLARATGLAGTPGSGSTMATMTHSPTLAQPLTAEGTIVGTFQYMSPEQLEGKEADTRSDLWALGCVLYEMATGRRAFEGKSQASLISAIMSGEPAPLTTLVPASSASGSAGASSPPPAALERVVKQCLAKDPDDRWQAAGDLKRELEWIASGSSSGAVAVGGARPRRPRERLAWTVAIALGMIAAAFAVFALRVPRAPFANVHVTLPAPEGAVVDEDDANTRISPDGGAVVFVATDSSGTSQLWVRELSQPESRPLAGTHQSQLPFWSPDSRFIGFFAEGRLKKVDRAGRNVQILCDAPDGRGGTWNRSGMIVFAPASSGGLQMVGESGGRPSAVTTPDTTRREQGHRFPSFLPDGNHFFYLVTSGDSLATRVGSVTDRTTRWLCTADAVAVYAPTGYLLSVRDGAILAQRFDTGSRTAKGTPQVVAPTSNSSRFTGAPPFSVSDGGVLVERHRSVGLSGLAWLDREGRRIGEVPVRPGNFNDIRLSPDDRRLALCVTSSQGSLDVWTIDLERGLATRLSFDQLFCEKPVWSPDGRWLAYSALAPGRRPIFRKLASGAGAAETLWAGRTSFTDPASWSADGSTLVFRDLDPQTGEDVWAMSLAGERRVTPVLNGLYHEEDASLSPDGRWLAFRSNESGRAEQYVQSFPVADAKIRVSTEGSGSQSRSTLGRAYWRRDGRELAYVGGDGVTVLSVPIETAGGLHAGTPRPLFRVPAGCNELAATSDLQRFLMVEDRATKESGSIQMILNWPAELKNR